MSKSVFAETYRPKKLDDVIGQDHVVFWIKKFVENKHIPHMMFAGPAGCGKCVSEDSLIFVNDVLMSFKEYNKIYTNNDYVLSDNKNHVNGIFYKEKTNHMVNVSLDDGTIINGTPEHKIKILDEEKGIIWKSLKDLTVHDTTLVSYNFDVFPKEKIKINFTYVKKKYDTGSKNISKEYVINEDISYFIGCIIGNGSICNKGVTISTHRKWLQDKLLKIVEDEFKIKGLYHYDKRIQKNVGIRINSCQLYKLLEQMDVKKSTARYKSVPITIRSSPKSVQISFLKGLFECDSYLSQCNLEYYTSSKDLCFMVRSMLMNIGIYCKIRNKYLKKYDHIYWTVVISSDFTKKIMKLFNMKFKNKKVIFTKDNNTNLGRVSSHSTLSKYVINILNKYQYSKNGSYILDNKLCRVEKKYTIIKESGYHSGLSNERFNRTLELKGRIKEIEDTLEYIKNNNIFLVDVKEIKNKKEECNVYDFHIPKNHTFICNNLINHNTTTAVALARELYGDDWKNYFLEINASDERTIDIIRNKVKGYAQVKVIDQDFKIIFMDEADNIFRDAQSALRRIIEKHSSKCRFILSANYPQKIIDPIIDRCVVFRFRAIKSSDIKFMLDKVVEKEDIDISPSALSTLATLSNGSMRRALGILETLKFSGLTDINDNTIYNVTCYVNDEFVKNLITSIAKGDIDIVDKRVNDLLDVKTYAPSEILDSMYRLIKDSRMLSTEAKLQALSKIGDVEFRITMGATPKYQLKTFMMYLILLYKKHGNSTV